MPASSSHVPPQSIEAEASVLGSMLVTEPALTRVIDEVKLNSADFYLDRHRAIFDAIHDLYAASKPVDELSVGEALTTDQCRAIGNGRASARAYVSELASKVPAAGNAKHYAEIVQRAAVERNLLAAAQSVETAIYEGRLNGEAPLLLERVAASVNALTGERNIDRWETGAAFILDAPAKIAAIWGRDDEVLLADGEPLVIAAPPGAGKTTLAQQLALGLAGIGEPELLGLPVAQVRGKVVYVAADRPAQAARSFRRMVAEEHRHQLADRVSIWRGPLPFDLSAEPHALRPFLETQGAGALILDSLGATAFDLAKDEAGSRIFAALGEIAAEGIQAVVLHHDRKREQGAGHVRTLDDVYGSRWITAAAGSVLYLDAQAGDLVVNLRHLKQPAGEFGPVQIRHDHEAGRTVLHEPADLLSLAADGLTVKQAASILFETNDPNANEIEKARRRLDKLADRGDLKRCSEPGEATVYRVAHGGGHGPHGGVTGWSHPGTHGGVTEVTASADRKGAPLGAHPTGGSGGAW